MIIIWPDLLDVNLYTDGINKVTNPARELFGEERLEVVDN